MNLTETVIFVRNSTCMAIEIERKFLVRKELLPQPSSKIPMKQGYLSVDPERLTRVRIAGNKAFLTIKGKGKGFSRPEFEYEIPFEDATELIKLAIFPPIEKIRYIINVGDKKWEVDIFDGANKGLIMAEIELSTEDERIVLPEWIEEEVTGDLRYFNFELSKKPFSSW